MALTTHPHLAPRLKKEYRHTSTPPLSLRGLLQGEPLYRNLVPKEKQNNSLLKMSLSTRQGVRTEDAYPHRQQIHKVVHSSSVGQASTVHIKCGCRDGSVGIATRLRADHRRTVARLPVNNRRLSSSTKTSDQHWGPLSLLWRFTGREANDPPHLVTTSGFTPPFTHTPSMACTGTTLLIYPRPC